MLLLGREIHKGTTSTESNVLPPGITSSQDAEHFSDEEYFPGANERSPHKRCGRLQCDTTKRNPGKRPGLKNPVSPKRGSYLTWSDEERKLLCDMMSRKVYRSWFQVRQDFNRKSAKRRSTNSVRGQCNQLGFGIIRTTTRSLTTSLERQMRITPHIYSNRASLEPNSEPAMS
jgi:hypothetical protein